jgi:Flavin-binding monooxygenase-like
MTEPTLDPEGGRSVDLPVAVVGGGGSGILAAIALKRVGVPFEVLEARDGVGGTWRYDPKGDGSAAYASLVANTSKLRTSIRGHRIPGRPWEYATHTEMLEYLEGVVDREGLRERFRFDWRVAGAREEDGGGAWTLRSEVGEERRYRALVCALGVNGTPRWGEIPGAFDGEQVHSSSYRTPERFEGRDVLVLGTGTSGCEIAGELAGRARSVTVAVRTPHWTMRRRLAGLPLDWIDTDAGARTLPWSVRRYLLAGACVLTTGSLWRRGLPRPTRRCGEEIVAISDSFPRAVKRGLVRFVPAVDSAAGREVTFADGTTREIDTIVHATGFDPPGGFLAEAARPDRQPLYRLISSPGHPGLSFVGLVEAHHGLLPIVEQQAGWAADALAGRLALPSPETMARVASAEAARRRRDLGPLHPFLVDHGRYVPMLRHDRRSGD